MDYEQKYKEALKRANDILKGYNPKEGSKATINYIFPELHKSEDESIRKRIIQAIKIREKEMNEEWSDEIAWLEKQGEQPKEATYTREVETGNGNIKALVTEKVQLPKFNVGNWYQCTKDFFGKGVTFDKNTAYYCAKEGCLQDEYGCHIAIVKDLYDNFKLWTIQDAKDGDVLCVKYGNDEIPFIFTGKQDDVAYCALNSFGEFVLSIAEWLLKTSMLPATKEQRDLLFQKMHEAGYEWDANNKELNKIHIIDEGKAEMDHCFTKMMNGENVSSTWSEEDEYMLNETIQHLEELIRIDKAKHLGCDVQYYQRDIDWLKLLKNKVYPKQEWTEEDKKRYISCLQRLGTGNPDQPETINSKWFKEHVCLQKQWKPTKEQMYLLYWIANIKVSDGIVE